VGGQDDLGTSLKAIMAARREGLGEPPTPDELLAYRDGLLTPEERQRIAAKIACHPDAARTLADLLAFPEVEAAPGTPTLSGADLDGRWQAFRQRLGELPAPGTGGAPADRGAREEPEGERAPRRRRAWGPALRLAAAVLLGLGLGWVGGGAMRSAREQAGSAIDVQIAELAPAGATGLRSEVPAVELPGSAEELVLVLGRRARAERDYTDYAVELLDRQGRRVWSRQGLHPTDLGTFQLSFRRGSLPPGRYRIDLFGRERGSRTHLATYELRLAHRGETR
jgi:anti-sigma factor RsiW